MALFRNTTTIYFIRHGQTPSNARRVSQGIHIDDYLSAEGVTQVRALAPIVGRLNLDMLFTSYLHRAEESAALIDRN